MGGWSVPGILAFAACSVGAGYGAWRFFIAYRITGCRISFAMAALSAMAPVAALTLAGATGEGVGLRAGLPAVGAVALTGFGLSRSRWLTPMTVGLWLPSAVANWRAGDGGPLTELLERALGEDGAATLRGRRPLSRRSLNPWASRSLTRMTPSSRRCSTALAPDWRVGSGAPRPRWTAAPARAWWGACEAAGRPRRSSRQSRSAGMGLDRGD